MRLTGKGWMRLAGEGCMRWQGRGWIRLNEVTGEGLAYWGRMDEVTGKAKEETQPLVEKYGNSTLK